MGRILLRERDSDAVANGAKVVWSLEGTMASGFCSSEDFIFGFSWIWVLGSIGEDSLACRRQLCSSSFFFLIKIII